MWLETETFYNEIERLYQRGVLFFIQFWWLEMDRNGSFCLKKKLQDSLHPNMFLCFKHGGMARALTLCPPCWGANVLTCTQRLKLAGKGGNLWKPSIFCVMLCCCAQKWRNEAATNSAMPSVSFAWQFFASAWVSNPKGCNGWNATIEIYRVYNVAKHSICGLHHL